MEGMSARLTARYGLDSQRTEGSVRVSCQARKALQEQKLCAIQISTDGTTRQGAILVD